MMSCDIRGLLLAGGQEEPLAGGRRCRRRPLLDAPPHLLLAGPSRTFAGCATAPHQSRTGRCARMPAAPVPTLGCPRRPPLRSKVPQRCLNRGTEQRMEDRKGEAHVSSPRTPMPPRLALAGRPRRQQRLRRAPASRAKRTTRGRLTPDGWPRLHRWRLHRLLLRHRGRPHQALLRLCV